MNGHASAPIRNLPVMAGSISTTIREESRTAKFFSIISCQKKIQYYFCPMSVIQILSFAMMIVALVSGSPIAPEQNSGVSASSSITNRHFLALSSNVSHVLADDDDGTYDFSDSGFSKWFHRHFDPIDPRPAPFPTAKRAKSQHNHIPTFVGWPRNAGCIDSPIGLPPGWMRINGDDLQEGAYQRVFCSLGRGFGECNGNVNSEVTDGKPKPSFIDVEYHSEGLSPDTMVWTFKRAFSEVVSVRLSIGGD